jgi:hypothetical protein
MGIVFGYFLVAIIGLVLGACTMAALYISDDRRIDAYCDSIYPIGDPTQDTPRVGGETPIARAAREASEVGKPRPEEIEAARVIITRAIGNPPDKHSLNCSGIYCYDCPLHKPCDDSAGLMTNAEEAAVARQWLSSHGIDPDAEIEAAR